ncbi:MAG: M20/M25/M40 family metallo-hydrolase [Candidatus Micrarchaeota archaeon]
MNALDILRKLVAIRSVSGEEGEIARWAAGFLTERGFEVGLQDCGGGRPNVFAKKGNPRLLFFGHMDTVPPAGAWTKDPFALTVEGDCAYGLGSWDMKGGLACILDSVQEAEDMAILFTVDEEEISRGSWKALERKGWFDGLEGIVSAEAGNTEGTFGGVRHISHGRQGRLAFRVTKQLSAGHAATAKEDWVEWIYSASKQPGMKSRIVIRNFHATSRGLSVPERAELDVDALIHPDEKDIDFRELVAKQFGGEAELVKRETPYLKPYSFENHPFLKKVGDVVSREYGRPEYHVGSSVGDENALAQLGIPIAIVGPEGRNEHRADEWVSVKSLEEISGLYRKLLAEI